jgi:hypothetical protein
MILTSNPATTVSYEFIKGNLVRIRLGQNGTSALAEMPTGLMTTLQDDRHISDWAAIVHAWLGKNRKTVTYAFVKR